MTPYNLITLEKLKKQKYGYWTVIEISKVQKNNLRYCLCLCECGNKKLVNIGSLRSGKSKSCGCLRKSLLHDLETIYNAEEKALVNVWKAMKLRCYNKKQISYKNYGGRGIKVCKEWENNRSAFIKWALENGWHKGLQIDRENNDGNYEPKNCRFVTAKVNAQNRRNTILNTELVKQIRENTTLSVQELASKYNVYRQTILHILKNEQWV
jgi:hypothetical protein